jgi:hypothetical protein
MSEEFCLIHGYEHMSLRQGDFIPTCVMCELIGDAVDERDAEIARLKAELQEAREIIQQQLGFPFGSAERARAFLDKAGK